MSAVPRCLWVVENQMPNLSKSPSREMPCFVELLYILLCVNIGNQGIFRSHLEAYLMFSSQKSKIWEIRDPQD